LGEISKSTRRLRGAASRDEDRAAKDWQMALHQEALLHLSRDEDVLGMLRAREQADAVSQLWVLF
jgi:hypothetical protein